jgi:catechol 2,3-dioxygenase-like lactoylglutathione lyase family enzyme
LVVERLRTQGLDHIAIAVSDVDRAEEFYRDVLGLDRAHHEWDPPRLMVANGSGVALFPGGNGSDPDPPEIPHIAFRADRAAFEKARALLSERGIEFRFSDHGSSHSIYFQDPDGHRLELTTYEI